MNRYFIYKQFESSRRRYVVRLDDRNRIHMRTYDRTWCRLTLNRRRLGGAACLVEIKEDEIDMMSINL